MKIRGLKYLGGIQSNSSQIKLYRLSYSFRINVTSLDIIFN